MLWVMLLCNQDLGFGRIGDHEFSNNVSRNRNKVWTVHSLISFQDFRVD